MGRENVPQPAALHQIPSTRSDDGYQIAHPTPRLRCVAFLRRLYEVMCFIKIEGSALRRGGLVPARTAAGSARRAATGAAPTGAHLKGLWASPYTLPVIARLDRAIQ